MIVTIYCGNMTCEAMINMEWKEYKVKKYKVVYKSYLLITNLIN